MSIPITPLYLDRPCVGGYDSQDVRDVLIPLDQILGSMVVVSWPGPEIRVYMQDDNHVLNDHSFFTTLESGESRATALPNADIAAFWHNSRNGYFIHTWLNQDPTPAWFGRWHLPAVQEPDRLPVLMQESGRLDFGHTFTDNDTGIDNEVIRKVSLRSGDIVTGLSLQFSNGSSGEDITQVLVCADGSVVQRLFLFTSTSIVERGPERRGAAILNQLIDEARDIATASSIAASAARNTQITQRWLLRAQADSMNEMTKHILDFENHGLDVGLFLGSLAAVVPVQHSEKQLAASVLATEST
ncbi:hypothetical protein DFH08DRAFT_1011948 [Mycena albidolilacea]|uniref:Uncharacterized protein n=1 Tax=Mycena albidolilacea TaxID=1033008 RepID=A0AAD7ENR8_9AGAR|nr:hypothetical protein DFH08DRAFT_1011948 [Mycena albidolilacea]